MNTITLRDGKIIINMDNVAYTEDYDQYPPGMTEEEATKSGQTWPVTMVVFNAPPVSDYGFLKLDLAHDERREFLQHFANHNAT